MVKRGCGHRVRHPPNPQSRSSPHPSNPRPIPTSSPPAPAPLSSSAPMERSLQRDASSSSVASGHARACTGRAGDEGGASTKERRRHGRRRRLSATAELGWLHTWSSPICGGFRWHARSGSVSYLACPQGPPRADPGNPPQDRSFSVSPFTSHCCLHC